MNSGGISSKLRNQIVAKNLIVVRIILSRNLIVVKKSNYKGIKFSDMNSHVRWTISRPGPHQKHSLKET